MSNIELIVKGMTCNHCKMAVEKALNSLDGVDSAEVNLEAGKVSITYDDSKIKTDAINEAIKEEGYEIVN